MNQGIRPLFGYISGAVMLVLICGIPFSYLWIARLIARSSRKDQRHVE